MISIANLLNTDHTDFTYQRQESSVKSVRSVFKASVNSGNKLAVLRVVTSCCFCRLFLVLFPKNFDTSLKAVPPCVPAFFFPTGLATSSWQRPQFGRSGSSTPRANSLGSCVPMSARCSTGFPGLMTDCIGRKEMAGRRNPTSRNCSGRK